jgi:hypothetical protein
MNWTKIERRIRHHYYQLRDCIPVQCPVCRTYVQRRHTRWARHHAAGYARLCLACHHLLFRPWSDEARRILGKDGQP